MEKEWQETRKGQCVYPECVVSDRSSLILSLYLREEVTRKGTTTHWGDTRGKINSSLIRFLVKTYEKRFPRTSDSCVWLESLFGKWSLDDETGTMRQGRWQSFHSFFRDFMLTLHVTSKFTLRSHLKSQCGICYEKKRWSGMIALIIVSNVCLTKRFKKA